MKNSAMFIATVVAMFALPFTAAAQPVAQDSAFTVAEGGSHAGLVTATGGDSELTFGLMSGPAFGTLVFNADGSFNYRAYRQPTVDFVGADSFTFVANDGLVTSNEATVTVTITPVNDAPVAQDSSFAVAEGGVHAGAVSATDVDGDTLTYVLVSGPAFGTVVFNADGSFSYQAHRQPTVGFIGMDSFTFEASDGLATSNIATVTATIVPVNDAPVAQDSAFTVAEGLVHVGAVSATDVDGDALTFALVSAPAFGTLVFDVDGSFSYEAHDSSGGADSFSFKANDGLADSNVASVSITIIADQIFFDRFEE